MQDLLAARFPNVTFLRIREILEKVLKVLRRISLGIRFLGGFTVVAGIAILAGAVSAGSARRGREVALLKTLGMTRRGVAATFAVEYALIGLVAGVIGAIGGSVARLGGGDPGVRDPLDLRPAHPRRGARRHRPPRRGRRPRRQPPRPGAPADRGAADGIVRGRPCVADLPRRPASADN